MSFTVAVGGATWGVGTELLGALERRNFPIGKLVPLGPQASAGHSIVFRSDSVEVRDIAKYNFEGTDLLFLCANSEISKIIAPIATAAGCVVIDNSSAFRMDLDVPLIVPEVNFAALDNWAIRRILPVASCLTIQLVVALKPLHDVAGLKRVVVSTYQAPDGAGRRMLRRLMSPADPVGLDLRGLLSDAKHTLKKGGEKPIAFNVVPHVGDFLSDGCTQEERNIEVESRKILGLPDLPVAVTCANVSALVGHAEAVTVEFERPIEAAHAHRILACSPGVRVLDEPRLGGYATLLDVEGTDTVWVSRIRRDASVPYGLHLWIVTDNFRKGATLNAVEIAEALVARDFQRQLRSD